MAGGGAGFRGCFVNLRPAASAAGVRPRIILFLIMPVRCIALIVSLATLPAPLSAVAHGAGKDRHPKKPVAVYLPEPDALPVKALNYDIAEPPPEARMRSPLDGAPVEGIDVSHYQGVIDWQEISKDKSIGYAYIKATEGEALVDGTYRRNIEGARKAGLKVGSYHYYRPNADGEAQLRNLTSQILPHEQDLAIIIDVESRGRKPHGRFIAELREFLEHVEEHYHSRPIVYTFQNFYNRYLKRELDDYRLMVSKYQEEEPLLTDGRDFCIWQYTSEGSMGGIDGCVDRSKVMPGFSVSDISFK